LEYEREAVSDTGPWGLLIEQSVLPDRITIP